MPLRDKSVAELAFLSSRSKISGTRAGAHVKTALLLKCDSDLIGISIADVLGETGDDVRITETEIRVGRALAPLDVDNEADATTLLGAFIVQSPVELGVWPWMRPDGSVSGVTTEFSELVGREVTIGGLFRRGVIRVCGFSARIKFAGDAIAKSYEGLLDIRVTASPEEHPSGGDLVITTEGEVCAIVVAGSPSRVIAVPCANAILSLGGQLADQQSIERHNLSFESMSHSFRLNKTYQVQSSDWFEVRKFEKQISTNPRRFARYKVAG